jgi:iduronate 2-sulfatase
MRKTVLILSAVIGLAATSPAHADAPAAKKKLNVLLIVSDDLNCHLGCYGSAIVKTPHIDRIAARGVSFDRAYCNYPVCNASRTSFLSGRYPDTTKVFGNLTEPRIQLGKDFQFLPEYFRAHGYFTAAAGKIAHYPEAVRYDVFSEPAHEKKKDKKDKKAKKDKKVSEDGLPFAWRATDTKDEDEPDGQVARRLVKVLEQNKDRPFFIAAGFHRPHVPHTAPKKYFDLYSPAKMMLPKEPPGHAKDIPASARPAKYFPDLTDMQKREIIAHYHAVTSFMDEQVGILLEALDRLKLWDNTLVIFISDHGWHLGEHGAFWAKVSLMEESARIPMIVAAPGKSTKTRSPRVVELVDLYPTLTELCGLKTPAGLQGKSFAPLLDAPRSEWQKTAYTVVTRKGGLGRSLRTEKHTYIEWPDGSAQLYDHGKDPHEYVNLVRDAEYAAPLRELRRQLSVKVVDSSFESKK